MITWNTYSDRMPNWKWSKARLMRRNPTEAEDVLWQRVRRKQLGLRFHRQTCMYGFIVDFWCPKKSLVVEVDGPSHDGRSLEDSKRDSILAGHGIKTVRFQNDQVLSDLESVVLSILTEFSSRSARRTWKFV